MTVFCFVLWQELEFSKATIRRNPASDIFEEFVVLNQAQVVMMLEIECEGLVRGAESWHRWHRWHRRCRTNHIWLDKMRFRWEKIGHIMARAKIYSLTLT